MIVQSRVCVRLLLGLLVLFFDSYRPGIESGAIRRLSSSAKRKMRSDVTRFALKIRQ